MRIENNTIKINMSRFSTVEERGCLKLQTVQGRFFAPGEYVLLDSYLRDFLKDEQGGVLIFQNREEAVEYANQTDLVYENERF